MSRITKFVRFPSNPMVVGNRKVCIGAMYGSASYLAGGDDMSYADFLFNREIHYLDTGGLSKSGTYYAQWVCSDVPQQNAKIKIYVKATNVEVANAVNLSAEIFTIRAEGK
jgi:hypothetical protein